MSAGGVCAAAGVAPASVKAKAAISNARIKLSIF